MARDFPNNVLNYLATSGSPASLEVIDTTSPYSVAAWVRPDSLASEMAVISKYNGHGPLLRVHAGGTVGLFTVAGSEAGAEAASTQTLATGVWQHVGGSWGGNAGDQLLHLYFEGVEDDTFGMASQSTDFGAADWHIGVRPGGTNPFDGLIAEVAIWSQQLSPYEWRALASGVPAHLVRRHALRGYWPLWGSGSPEPDYAGFKSSMIVTGTLNPARMPPVAPFIIPSPAIPAAPGVVIITDADTVYLNLQALVTEEFPVVYFNLQSSGTEQRISTDTATVLFDLSVLGGECFSTWSALQVGEGEADLRWRGSETFRWIGAEQLRWSLGEVSTEGIHC